MGTISLVVAVAGAVACHFLAVGPLAGASWLRIAAAGFEAAVVGALADWFAVTALFRHPLGLPIPHTAIIPKRRAKLVEGVVSMIEEDWLSPQVIAARLDQFEASAFVVDWLRDRQHVERLGAPLRDVLAGLARTLTEPEVVEFVDRALRRELSGVSVDPALGRWLARAAGSDSAAAAFRSAALSLANFLGRPRTAVLLQDWIDHAARQMRRERRLLVPLLLRRKAVQRRIVETVCDYGSAELRAAADDVRHALRGLVFGGIGSFAERLAAGDEEALAQVEQLRHGLIDSLEAGPLVRDVLAQLRRQLESDLREPGSYLSELIDRKLRAGILDLLREAERREQFDRWVRATAGDLLRRHHDQIGVTVRENLEALETERLVAQIEDRVGGDLQFIRLNGAVVGGMIGLVLALVHRFFG